jgi:hypothetical protein
MNFCITIPYFTLMVLLTPALFVAEGYMQFGPNSRPMALLFCEVI